MSEITNELVTQYTQQFKNNSINELADDDGLFFKICNNTEFEPLDV